MRIPTASEILLVKDRILAHGTTNQRGNLVGNTLSSSSQGMMVSSSRPAGQGEFASPGQQHDAWPEQRPLKSHLHAWQNATMPVKGNV
ncbi:MAG: hypothetical protein H6662_02885 [Ardenticatenaceae bacterium]|nr:hypothetical protein [Ardenticatenaceae bacterium]